MNFTRRFLMLLTAVGIANSGTVGLLFGADGSYSDFSNYSSFNNAPTWPSSGSLYTQTPVRVFFPPDPPPLDRLARNIRPGNFGYRNDAAPELASYVNEPFYPALAARLDNHQLSARMRETLARYREEKRTLEHALHTEVARVRLLDPPARSAALAALGRDQDPKIAGLEKRADELRAELLKSDYAWSALREWHLGESERHPDSARDIANVMRAAAYFQSGLSRDQRTVLREIAIEIPTAADSVEAAAAAQPYVFFSPGPSRVRFPDNVPPELSLMIAAYQNRRSTLRKQLYDVVFREDGAWLAVKRTVRLQALAKEQAPEFAVLEELAEDIRRDLAAVPAQPNIEPLVPLPPTINQRVMALFQRQVAEQKGALGKVDEIRSRYPSTSIRATLVRDRLSFSAVEGAARDSSADREHATLELRAVAVTYKGAVTEMIEELKAIRQAIARHLHTEDVSQVNVALNEGARLAIEESLAEAIGDYRAAVFEPGLSPGQRRLLFDYAIEQYELPLPNGEFQPRQRRITSIGRSDR